MPDSTRDPIVPPTRPVASDGVAAVLRELEAAEPRLRERVLEQDVVLQGRYLTFRVDTAQLADGSVRTREICGHPGAVAIVALDEKDRVLLVRQFRLAAGRVMLEIPAGTLDVERDGSIEDPALAAPRELEEETGFRAGSWRELASFWTAPGFASERMTLYLATDLRPADDDRRGPDEDERLELVRLPWQDALDAALGGAIVDAKSLLGLLWLERMKRFGEA